MTDETLTIGWNAAQIDRSKITYRVVLGLNLVLHVLIGLFCIAYPAGISDFIGLPDPIPEGWARAWGAMLILVTALYVPGWLDPDIRRAPNIIGILGRYWMGTIWVLCGGGFLWFAAFDYFFGFALALLYWRFFRSTLMSRP
jgi:hypothetical protein